MAAGVMFYLHTYIHTYIHIIKVMNLGKDGDAKSDNLSSIPEINKFSSDLHMYSVAHVCPNTHICTHAHT